MGVVKIWIVSFSGTELKIMKDLGCLGLVQARKSQNGVLLCKSVMIILSNVQ